ncbi:hypothetical protein EDD16DRAFT_1497614, partial [Pisolithus croceorrhizus]
FDRLEAARFSEGDIANFRTQFHGPASTNYFDLAMENDDDCTSFHSESYL